jgi:hypothetical protein
MMNVLTVGRSSLHYYRVSSNRIMTGFRIDPRRVVTRRNGHGHHAEKLAVLPEDDADPER